eukprot:992061_1
MSVVPTDCESSCPIGEFCGIDGECHTYSCNDWYQFGSLNFTGYDSNLPLSCEERSQFDGEYPDVNNAGVIFGCTGFSGSIPTPPKAVAQQFTRKCTRDDDDKLQTFVCYEMANATNFQPFIVEAQGATIDPCSGDYPPDVPSYLYQVMVERQKPGDGYIAALNTGDATAEFDKDIAMRTMYAKLDTQTANPTASPTVSPTSRPTINNNVNGASYATNPGTLLFVGAFHILRMFM